MFVSELVFPSCYQNHFVALANVQFYLGSVILVGVCDAGGPRPQKLFKAQNVEEESAPQRLLSN